MSIHLRKEIENLKKRILSLSTLVEESVRRAIRSVEERDISLAEGIIEDDLMIDRMEVAVEEECLKLLALYQPVAIDLRFIVAILKVNNDLERIGDLSVNIAEATLFLGKEKKIAIPFDLPEMAEKTQLMLKKSLDALVNMDPDLARMVCDADDEVDEINREMYGKVKEAILNEPNNLNYLIQLLTISRHLERIADLATNIAEDVIYMVKGEIIRHRSYTG
jgi:phosphate transport system protein